MKNTGHITGGNTENPAGCWLAEKGVIIIMYRPSCQANNTDLFYILQPVPAVPTSLCMWLCIWEYDLFRISYHRLEDNYM